MAADDRQRTDDTNGQATRNRGCDVDHATEDTSGERPTRERRMWPRETIRRERPPITPIAREHRERPQRPEHRRGP
jgi:hypothetical protein